MTDPSQYFRGRTVQEQMNEVIGYVDVRSAEVATDAIASDVAQVHQDMLDADADATAAAASAAAAAGTLANAVKKTGEASQSIDGDIDLNDDLNVDGDATFGGTVTVQTPTANANPATKKYVDDADALKLNITDVNQYALGLTGDQSFSGVKYWNTVGSSSAAAGKDVQPRVVTESTGFERTVLQGVNRHYPLTGLLDKNGEVVCKLVVSTSDSSINVYLQAIALDGTSQATKTLGTFDRATGVWS